MKNSVRKEVKELIKKLDLNCSVKEFKDEVYWNNISANQKLSEDFIREFQDEVEWYNISYSQKLSEDFIREFQSVIVWSDLPQEQQCLKDKFEQEKNMNIITGNLYDKSDNGNKKVPVKVEIDNGSVYIYPKGYGDCSSTDGHGCPIMLEVYENELRVIAWTNINKEDPEVIKLEKAREELREKLV